VPARTTFKWHITTGANSSQSLNLVAHSTHSVRASFLTFGQIYYEAATTTISELDSLCSLIQVFPKVLLDYRTRQR